MPTRVSNANGVRLLALAALAAQLDLKSERVKFMNSWPVLAFVRFPSEVALADHSDFKSK
ncbi:MAG: hypothetical protein PHQ58_21935 [Rhodoferax sp.]|nr:hypothetical protein [Rhodoferax sp.]